MFVVFFYDNNTNKIKIEDLAISSEDAEKKIIQFGKDFIENENGRKHLEKCVKEFNCDLTKEDDGFYLIKHVKEHALEKVELIKKVIKIDEFKGWTGTYSSTKTELYNLGYYSYTNFDKKLLNIYSQINRPTEISSTGNISKQVSPVSSINNFSSVITSLKENGFKPNKNCTFKFNINRKERENTENTENNNIKFNDLIKDLNKITQNEIRELSYEEKSDDDKYSDINDDYYDSDEHYDLLANNLPVNYDDISKSYYLYSGDYIVGDIDRDISDSESEYVYSDEYPDYYMNEEINKVEKVEKVATQKLGDIKFIRKEWKCD